MKRILTFLMALVMVFGLTMSAHATLFDRGGELIYDDYLDITWLQDANYAQTSGYAVNPAGFMNWSDAMTWADNLVYQGYDDWRLPTALNQDGSGPCGPYNCTGSEMGYLFFVELGGTFASWPYNVFPSIYSIGDPNLALFLNLQLDTYYWASTEWAAYPDIAAWSFGFGEGFGGWQVGWDKDYLLYAWAVRDGDSSPVPEPSTLLLLGSGLAGLVALRRRLGRKEG